MTEQGDRGSAKRFKSSTGGAISAPLRVTPTASLPLYQPPEGARVSPTTAQSSASLSRTQAGGSPSLRLTVKAPPSKLREATSNAHHGQQNPDDDEQVSSSAAPVGRSVRSTRNPRAVVEPDSDDDDDEEMDDNLEPELTGERFDDEDEDMDDDEDAEGEEDDDEIVASHPPPPRIQQTTNTQGKPKVKVSAPREGTLQSVEAKELEDEDMSDLDSDDEGQINTTLGPDDDEELDEDEDEDEDDDDMEDGSRSATPDLTKLTRRQRGQFEEEEDPSLLALSNEAQKKKHISAEEHVMRRAEMARRRKNLSEKRNEEEKIDTINKLLKKPAPKRRTRAEILAAQANNNGTPGAEGEDGDEIPADPVYVRWINSASGSMLGVPTEWLQSPAGEVLAPADQRPPGGARILVEEVA
ncbi:hypothetical protein AMS68_002650 [Peltaster fructicola]|uniref:INO80 complex subunit B-like conserved region domain-containing protein n=1 Tax=Peltaster fructicola TaxID=286661 RepID=A0A6H0XR02_9PEZI|nr:hypothetical protein AMS68_002650 [Peltaster fructicola]